MDRMDIPTPICGAMDGTIQEWMALAIVLEMDRAELIAALRQLNHNYVILKLRSDEAEALLTRLESKS